jgi:FMN phosphatase YigB (HAD superfamily)
LELLEVAPSNAIHCGDLPTQDIRGAAALGMTTVLYTGCHQDEPGEFVPDYTISDWRELPAIVAEVFG